MNLGLINSGGKDIVRQAVLGGSMGVGGMIAWKLVENDPHAIIETFRTWGPLSLLCVLGLVMVNSGFRSMVEAAKESSAAQQRLADAVNSIANKDSYETQQQKIVLDHVATTLERVLVKLETVERNTESRGAGT
jgi:hypothetical protein